MMREFEIERQFQIKIDIIKANKGIYYIKTNKGERCLKKQTKASVVHNLSF